MSGGATTLHIVRHGNTFAPGEPALRVGARTDIPLVESGIAQGRALGRAFAAAGIGFARILASPLRRTRETAELILAAQADAVAGPVAIESADWLVEIDHGPDEGLADAAIVARIGPAALAAWDSDAIVPPGWDVDVAGRLAAWRAFYAAIAGTGGTILVVTSNGSARFALMAQAALFAQARGLPSLKIRTGAWGTIAVDKGGDATLLDWDRRPDA